MKDVFEFQSPLGIFGLMVGKLFLKKYMTGLLMERNRVIKEFAEGRKMEDFSISRDLVVPTAATTG